MTKMILPCAGFGSRMNMKINESKEMLLDSNKVPLIEYSLCIAKMFGIQPLIITRKEKTDLIDYCKDKAELVILDEPGEEWPATVLASYPNWGKKNILVLPDTRFDPVSIVNEVNKSLDSYDIVFATHQVTDPQNWGIVQGNRACEKPVKFGNNTDPSTAWGIIGYHNDAGIDLFKDFSRKEQWFYVGNNQKISLNYFKDITRSGYIE